MTPPNAVSTSEPTAKESWGDRLFYSPRGLYPFQAQFAAHGYLRDANLVVADTGLGKTIIALATAAMLFEDDKVDLVIFVVEGNKLDEWESDIATFTNLTSAVLHGPRRGRILKMRLPQTLVTTYQTAKLEIGPGGRLSSLLEGNWRVLVVYDEMALLGTSDDSAVYLAHAGFIQGLRERSGGVRTMGLTATPMTSSPLNYFNIANILSPEVAGPRDQFILDHVASYNSWGKPSKFKNLDLLAQKLEPLILRKRKTDPDVVDKFPKLVEKFVPIEPYPEHLDAYHSLDDWIEEQLPPAKRRFAFQSLMAFSCHPHSVMRSSSEVIQDWITEWGSNNILRMKSAKAESLIGTIKEILSQNDQDGILVFAYHTSVLRCLSDDLAKAKIDHVLYDGEMTQPQRNAAKAAFKGGKSRVMLASSAAERGVNLPEAGYIINFDVPILHSSYLQRLSRGSRIDAKDGGLLVVRTLIGKHTMEQAAVKIWNRRNAWSDAVQDFDADEDEFVSAVDRLEMIRNAAREERKVA